MIFRIKWFKYNRFINEALNLILTFTYVNESGQNGGDNNRRQTKIIVANRVSLLDTIVLRKFISNNKCKVVCEIELNSIYI